MHKKLIIFLFLFLSLSGCSKIQFVYDNAISSKLYKNVSYSVVGDRSDIVKYSLSNYVDQNNEDPDFNIYVSTEETLQNLVIANNQTATQIQVEHKIDYTLKRLFKNCEVLTMSISTTSIYIIKSSGYSFGTDLAKNTAIEESIDANIVSFLNQIERKDKELLCKDES